MSRHATALETVRVVVPEAALEAYEAAIGVACATVGFFLDEASGLWTVEGVKDQGSDEVRLADALALAGAATGVSAPLERAPVAAEGWLARSFQGFPEQPVGRRFLIRGTHLPPAPTRGRIVLTLDAAMAFGSGEHGSTRGCLRALERVAYRRPRRTLDLGTGTGILAMAAATVLHRRVRASDIDPWSVRTARDNARRNGLAKLVGIRRGDGWRAGWVRRGAPYDLVLANILARPLCAMARPLAGALAPGGTAILSGLLDRQARWVLGSHRRQGLVLDGTLHEGGWATLVLRKPRR